jgi:hypothetical protein
MGMVIVAIGFAGIFGAAFLGIIGVIISERISSKIRKTEPASDNPDGKYIATLAGFCGTQVVTAMVGKRMLQQPIPIALGVGVSLEWMNAVLE